MQVTKKLVKSELDLIKETLDDLTNDDIEAIADKIEFESDFFIELEDGREYRFIEESVIDKTYFEECKQTIQECYDLTNVPNFIEIDWTATVENCKVDGYGVQFAYYDHEELNAGDWYVFRTN